MKYFSSSSLLLLLSSIITIHSTDGQSCASSDPSSSTIGFASDYLNLHNTRRADLYAENGVSNVPLTWSEDLAKAAQEWATIRANDGCTLIHSERTGEGENIYAAYSTANIDESATPLGALQSWYEDEKDLTFPSNLHFTQVGWRSTEQVGCAQVTFDRGDTEVFRYCIVSVCQYYPAGNCNVDADNVITRMLLDSATECTTTACPTYTGSIFGDPHIMKWNGKKYSFHGECDLVFLNAPNFQDGLGLDIHVRTTIEDFYSYISAVAIRAGSFVVNIEKEGLWMDNELIGNFPTKNESVFRITRKISTSRATLLNTTSYEIFIQETYKMRIRVGATGIMAVHTVTPGQAYHNAPHFAGSMGMMGEYPSGKALGRDGTEFVDMKQFGMEWQVQPYEEVLFLDVREPQLPHSTCRMPTKSANKARKLRNNPELHKTATEACADAEPALFDDCVDDVISSGGNIAIASTY